MIKKQFNTVKNVALISLTFIACVIPFLDNTYVIHFMIHTFMTIAYALSWNIMAGFCGQYSFGHALYAGLGGYLSAHLLIQYQLSPLLCIPFIFLLCGFLGGGIAYLSARLKIEHAYFTLLTIAFLECTRILFEAGQWFGGASGLFIPLSKTNSLLNLRLSEVGFYYVFLCLIILFTFATRGIFKHRLGHSARALNHNIDAAHSVGINTVKIQAIMMFISSGFTSVVGVISAFYQNSLFPDQAFSMQKSLNMIIAPLLGGLGSPWGSLIGGVIMTTLGEGIDWFLEMIDFEKGGLKQVIYGIILLIVILKIPRGVWPDIKKYAKTYF